MHRKRCCGVPFAAFPILALLGYFAYVDFGVEVRGKCFAVIACIAIDYIEVVHLVEVVFGGVCGEDRCYTRVEAAAEYGCKPRTAELILICPLPRVLEVCLIFGFVVGGVEVVYAALEAGVHNGQVLIRQSNVYDDFGFELVE